MKLSLLRWWLPAAVLVLAVAAGCDDGDGTGTTTTDPIWSTGGSTASSGSGGGASSSGQGGSASSSSGSGGGLAIGPGNPASVGFGALKTIVIDGANTAGEWGSDTLLIADPAADDARFLGANWCAHEQSWDYVALHAAWDDANLYLGIQYTNITDVVDPANLGSSEGSQIQGSDLVQHVVLDTIAGAGYTTGGDMWGKDQEFVGPNQPDFQLYFHSNFSQEGTYLGRHTASGWSQLSDGSANPDLTGAAFEALVGQSLPGVDPHGDDSSPGSYGPADVDYLAAGHNPGLDTFFELQIPLALLAITSEQLAQGTIGVFAANGDGSAVDSIPNDGATSDTPGTSPSNSPLEWDMTVDDDQYSEPFALIGTP